MELSLRVTGEYDEGSSGLRLAVAQLEYQDGDKEENAEKACEVIDVAAKCGARLLVFPEKYLTGFLDAEQWQRVRRR
jgi:predicted amidohydrolase